MRITHKKRFVVAEAFADSNEVKFLNKKGSFDALHFGKYYAEELKATPSLYLSGQRMKANKVKTESTVTYTSKWYEESYFEWLKELIASPVVIINDKPVRVLNKTYKFDSYDKLFVIEIEVANELADNNIRF